MAAWIAPLLMGLAGAGGGKLSAREKGKSREQSYNNRTMLERPDYTNWAYSPEQNEQFNKSDIFLGDILSIAQNLLNEDLGFLKTRNSYTGGGGSGGSTRKQYQGKDRPRGDRYA